ncbi:hypothetical protein KC357_g206 [Hortaea werneckii]|nr:hypothetical protein KC357_g206 [Hortaea werneckii]
MVLSFILLQERNYCHANRCLQCLELRTEKYSIMFDRQLRRCSWAWASLGHATFDGHHSLGPLNGHRQPKREMLFLSFQASNRKKYEKLNKHGKIDEFFLLAL